MDSARGIEFRSGTRSGFQESVAGDILALRVRKGEHEVQVRFAAEECAVATAEGTVHARAGDAIITGGAGEQWPVPPARFRRKYKPVPPTVAGADGTYRSLALPVLALQMREPFAVVLADGRSRLQGQPGDWLVDHGDGSLGIVAERIFASTYAINPPKRRIAFYQRIQALLLTGVRLDPAVKVTVPEPPAALAALINRIAAVHQAFDQRAIEFGNRYRSAFWSIYLLSSLAVLCAVLPLALGWDDRLHAMHPFAGVWAVCEVCLIGVVAVVYRRGHHRDWQGLWLAARTKAELAWYLPLLAPLVDFAAEGRTRNWYARVFQETPGLQSVDEIDALCAQCESMARQSVQGCWADAGFVSAYARWTAGILEEQRQYHLRVARRQHALLHRVHAINTWLFVLTAAGALTHLAVHSLWLSLLTIFFPALGASLHGALAQSEAYRLEASSGRLAVQLQTAGARIEAALAEPQVPQVVEGVRMAVQDALALILDEHQDWHMLVRPHHLPLA